jgi:ElaB/YqjD/DUF883 family membrane-anchored ribosome-binding protein
MTQENATNPAAEAATDDCSAADLLHRAKAELEKAQAHYEHVRKHTAERLQAVRETSVGDAIDCTLDTVKRHPGASLTLAALLGFWLGRLFRR